MKALNPVAWMVLLSAAAVQADEPKEPVPAVASVSETPAVKSAETLAAEDKALHEKAEKDKERQAWAVKQMRAQGYKPQTRKDGSVLWCRNEVPIGSHLEQQRCSTIEQVLDTQKKGQELTKQMFDQANRGVQSN